MNILRTKIQSRRAKLFFVSSVFYFFLFSLVTPTISYAAATYYNPSISNKTPAQYTLLEPLPCLDNADGCKVGEMKPTVTFEKYVNYMFTLFIALSAVAAVFMIVWGGFKYTTTDSYSGKSEGKQVIFNALQGLLLVLCSYLILRTIDPRLVNIPSTIVPPLNIKTQTNLVSSFFDQLGVKANSFGSDRAAAKQIIAASQTDVTKLQTKLTDLSTQYKQALANGDEEAINRLQVEIGSVQNDIEKVSSGAAVRTAWIGMLSSVDSAAALANTPELNTVAKVQEKITYINQLYDGTLAQLQQVSNPPDPDQKKLLDDQKNFALGMLTIQKDAIAAGSSWTARASSVWGATKGAATILNPMNSINPLSDPISSTIKTTYNGYKTGYQTGANKNFVSAVGNDVIKGYANNISNQDLKNQLIEAANGAIGG